MVPRARSTQVERALRAGLRLHRGSHDCRALGGNRGLLGARLELPTIKHKLRV